MKTGVVRASGKDINLSRLVLGTCYFGTDISEKDSFRMMDAYYENGGRAVDTARVYASWLPGGLSASERTVGKWIHSRALRDEVTLITKGAHPPIGRMDMSRLSPSSLRYDLEDSLKALESSYVDIYLLHRDDKSVPVSVIMDTLHEFVKEGKTRAIGASNWTIDRILEANAYVKAAGKTPFTVSQIQWSLAQCTPESWGDPTLCCMIEEDYFVYRNEEIPVMAFSPQAKGLFSKYIKGGREALNEKIVSRFLTDTNMRRIERVRKLCNETGVSPAAVVSAFITCNPLSSFAILGCSDINQLRDTMTADNVNLSKDIIEFLIS